MQSELWLHVDAIVDPHAPPPAQGATMFSQLSHGSPVSGAPASLLLLQSVVAHWFWQFDMVQTHEYHARLKVDAPPSWWLVQHTSHASGLVSGQSSLACASALSLVCTSALSLACASALLREVSGGMHAAPSVASVRASTRKP
jgi:hypothetical protein